MKVDLSKKKKKNCEHSYLGNPKKVHTLYYICTFLIPTNLRIFSSPYKLQHLSAIIKLYLMKINLTVSNKVCFCLALFTHEPILFQCRTSKKNFCFRQIKVNMYYKPTKFIVSASKYFTVS